MKTKLLFALLLTLFFAKTSFASTISSCVNPPSSPIDNGDGTFTAEIDCSLYNDVDTYTISLASLLTQDTNGAVTPGYAVIINGDPNTLPDDGTGLLNQSLWEAVLFFDPDLDVGTGSDELTMYWAGAFPTVATVINYDQNEYAGDGFPDSDFFEQSTGSSTIYGSYPNSYDVLDLSATPEPSSFLLFGTGLAMLGGLLLRRHAAVR